MIPFRSKITSSHGRHPYSASFETGHTYICASGWSYRPRHPSFSSISTFKSVLMCSMRIHHGDFLPP